MATVRDTKGLASRWNEEIWHEQNVNVIDDLVAAEFVGYNPSRPEPLHGPEAVRGAAEMVHEAFPDIEVQTEEVVAEDDRIAQRVTVTATHEGEFMGIDPTGTQVTFTGMNFSRVEDGKWIEGYEMWDMLGLLQRLGILELPTVDHD